MQVLKFCIARELWHAQLSLQDPEKSTCHTGSVFAFEVASLNNAHHRIPVRQVKFWLGCHKDMEEEEEEKEGLQRSCCNADEADRSFQEGLEGAKKSSQLSAIASMGTQNATPCTIVSLQLPIAGILHLRCCIICSQA